MTARFRRWPWRLLAATGVLAGSQVLVGVAVRLQIWPLLSGTLFLLGFLLAWLFVGSDRPDRSTRTATVILAALCGLGLMLGAECSGITGGLMSLPGLREWQLRLEQERQPALEQPEPE